MSDFSPADRAYMARALLLAARGLYTTTPNPRVRLRHRPGRPRDRRRLSRSRRRAACRGERADRRAPQRPRCARRDALCHVRSLAIITAARRRASMRSWRQACRGSSPPCKTPIPQRPTEPSDLREAGIRVDFGLLENEARELNIGFVSRMTRGLPWVRMKVAASARRPNRAR